MRLSAGAATTRALSIASRCHSASARSSISSPSSSWRPSRVPPYIAVTCARNDGARFAALSVVRALVVTTPGASISRRISGMRRGVVVTAWRGRAPSRSPNCSMSQVSSA